jgi:hypothetical protein
MNLGAQTTSESGQLLSLIASEQQRGSVLTYSQSYVDAQNERVTYQGTLYAGIHLFKIDNCEVTARVAIQDRYSGAIERRSLGRARLEQTGELKDDTVYEYRFNLGELDVDGIRALRAVPAQLNKDTKVQCEEDRSCSLAWVQITEPKPKIAETRTVNGIQDVDSRAASMVLPMSSSELADQAARFFSGAIRSCSANAHQ